MHLDDKISFSAIAVFYICTILSLMHLKCDNELNAENRQHTKKEGAAAPSFVSQQSHRISINAPAKENALNPRSLPRNAMPEARSGVCSDITSDITVSKEAVLTE